VRKKPSNWGAAGRRNHHNNNNKKPNVGRNPLAHYGNVDNNKDNKDEGRRNYDKPWQLPEKEKKEAKTYAEHVYRDGIGPDTELIKMIEDNILLKNPQVDFDDIAELDEVKKLLQEAVLLPILMPDYFRGIRRPWKGICMFGPPGTGKTMLAKAIATQGKTTFFNVSPSQLSTKWKGESEKLVRILFDIARFYAPSTIFFDEIDAMASQRGGSGEHEASRKVKSELLIQMDGVGSGSSSTEAQGENDAAKKVIVIAATNRPWDLDEAIRRRLEKRVYIPLPTPGARKSLFEINLKGISLSPDINFDLLVEKTEGYSGADLTNVCREASMMPLRDRLMMLTDGNIENLKNKQDEITRPLTMDDFLEAVNNVCKSVNKEQLDEF
jgi:katanin p60 ATPase-containing subunit A1